MIAFVRTALTTILFVAFLATAGLAFTMPDPEVGGCAIYITADVPVGAEDPVCTCVETCPDVDNDGTNETCTKHSMGSGLFNTVYWCKCGSVDANNYECTGTVEINGLTNTVVDRICVKPNSCTLQQCSKPALVSGVPTRSCLCQ